MMVKRVGRKLARFPLPTTPRQVSTCSIILFPARKEVTFTYSYSHAFGIATTQSFQIHERLGVVVVAGVILRKLNNVDIAGLINRQHMNNISSYFL